VVDAQRALDDVGHSAARPTVRMALGRMAGIDCDGRKAFPEQTLEALGNGWYQVL